MRNLLRRGTGIALGLSLSLQALPGLAGSLSPQSQELGAEQEQLARGGRGGGGRGGGSRGGRSFSGGGSNYGRSGGASRSSSVGRTGFGNYSNGGSAYRGSSKPAGGFSSGSKQSVGGSRQSQLGANASNRQQSRQATAGDRQGQRTDRTDIRQDNRTERSSNRQGQRSERVSDRTDVRRDRADNRWDNYWSGWARPGWGYARPWNYGWYGGGNAWPWWGAGAAFGALATAAIIDEAVDDAISTQTTTIVVPDTSYSLYYSSIEPVNDDAVTFAVDMGSGVVEMTADCRQGTLDSQVPRTQAEAQLLNAACEVAFGKG